MRTSAANANVPACRSAVSVEGQFRRRRRYGVAGTWGNEMDMTADSEEDSKLHTPVLLTGAPCSRPRSDSASV